MLYQEIYTYFSYSSSNSAYTLLPWLSLKEFSATYPSPCYSFGPGSAAPPQLTRALTSFLVVGNLLGSGSRRLRQAPYWGALGHAPWQVPSNGRHPPQGCTLYLFLLGRNTQNQYNHYYHQEVHLTCFSAFQIASNNIPIILLYYYIE